MLTYHPPLATPLPAQSTRLWLLVLFCIAWLLPGTFGHTPWRLEEAEVVGVVFRMQATGNWLVPQLNQEIFLHNPPLIYWLGCFFAQCFAGILSLHESIRLVSLILLGGTLLTLGLAGRAAFGQRQGRMVVLLMLGAVGFLSRAHLVMPEQAVWLGYALFLLGIVRGKGRPAVGLFQAATPPRPLQAGCILGLGLGITALSGNALDLATLLVSLLLLPLFWPAWRTARILLPAYILALTILLPCALIWPLSLARHAPQAFALWYQAQLSMLLHLNAPQLSYYGKIWLWFTFPVWPLTLLALWQNRHRRETRQDMLAWCGLGAVWFLASTFQVELLDIKVAIALLPLPFAASRGIESLRRGASGAFYWFGLMAFGCFATLIWLGWWALHTGQPHSIALRMAKASPSYLHSPHPWLVGAAVLLTFAWIWQLWRGTLTGRKTVLTWAVGATMTWGLSMTLWLPWIEARFDYRPILKAVALHTQSQKGCMTYQGVSPGMRGLFDYYYQLPLTAAKSQACPWLFTQTDTKTPPLTTGTLIWSGARPREKRTIYRLYQTNRPPLIDHSQD